MSAPTLERQVFTLSRALEFFSERELTTQIGYDRQWWPIALVKELIDNGLDACENAGAAPELSITVQPDAVAVQDNGPGLPLATLERSLDYQVRVSDKIGYVAPTRGQQGNALKTIWAAPYVIDGEAGQIDVTTGGTIYHVEVALDRIAQQPALSLRTSPDGHVKNGTAITMHWPQIASYLDHDPQGAFYSHPPAVWDLISGYSLFNPHATLRLAMFGKVFTNPATDPGWHKWLPSAPTSPHWYSAEALRSLIAAYLAEERRGDRPRTVREFVAEFAGLSGSAKQKTVTEAAGLTGAYLHDLISGGDVDLDQVASLLQAMQAEARVIQPQALGVLGEAHLRQRLVADNYVAEEGLAYRKITGLTDGLPWVLEVAFGVLSEDYQGCGRTVTVGLNWAPALRSPLPQLDRLLGEQRIDRHDPVVLAVHLASPRLAFTDRGKSRLALPTAIEEALASAVQAVTKSWKTAKRQADKDDRVRQKDLDKLRKAQKRRQLSIKEAAYEVMATAYLKASAGGTLPANARQIMYAARPLVLQLTGGRCWDDKNTGYFTQTLLNGYIDEHPEEAADWDVVFDARGHIAEPHTERRIDLGTLAVRRYVATWSSAISEAEQPTLAHAVATAGPGHRYRYALFIEKEGFTELLAASRLAERYDLAIMSTKGMSTTAARQLVEALSRQGVTILVAHDFDKAGFSILHTLRTNTWRYTFDAAPRVIDLGLRLADVQEMGLQSEPVEYDSKIDPRANLAESGATEDEQRYLVRGRIAGARKLRKGRYVETGGWVGERVELNAMASDQLIAWLEGKLAEHQVRKLVPDAQTLAIAYRRAVRVAHIQKAIDAAIEALPTDEVRLPPDLGEVIERRIAGTAMAWDQALFELVHPPWRTGPDW